MLIVFLPQGNAAFQFHRSAIFVAYRYIIGLATIGNAAILTGRPHRPLLKVARNSFRLMDFAQN